MNRLKANTPIVKRCVVATLADLFLWLCWVAGVVICAYLGFCA
jgi:hypothetical protein